MGMDYGRRVIILEGPNYAGKSTLLDSLKRGFPGSMVMEFHGYYGRKLLRSFAGRQDPLGEAVGYNLDRLGRVAGLMESQCFDTFLLERFHGSDFVYKNMLFEIRDFWRYAPLEDRLNSMGATLVTLTVDDNVLLDRMQGTSRVERKAPDAAVPAHLTDFDLSRRNRDLYEEFHGLSTLEDKMLVRSTNTTDNDEIVARIREAR